jgi:hypothetical protein
VSFSLVTRSLVVNNLDVRGFWLFSPSLSHGVKFLFCEEFLQDEVSKLISIQGGVNPAAFDQVSI